jgi:uncharacterized protein YdbL (DUF1318 family)
MNVATSEIKTEVNKVSRFLLNHEKLIVLVLCLGAALYSYRGILGLLERHDQRVANAANAALQAQANQNKALADANAQAASQYQQLATQLAASNKALAEAQTARDTATKNQQAADRLLTPSELGNRWTNLLNIAPESVQVEPGGKGVPDALVITPEGAKETVVQLEEIPGLRADLKDEQTIAANQATQITSLAGLNTGLHNQIDGLDSEITKQTAACEADKKLLKAQARRGKLKWFAVGWVTGLATRGALKIFAGI